LEIQNKTVTGGDMRFIIFQISAYMLFLLLLMACQTEEMEKTLSKEELINEGAYLVEIAGCNDCHTPKKMTSEGPVFDTSLLLSGHPQNAEIPEVDASLLGPGKWGLMNEHLTAFVGPWGMSFSANLTPDDQTGIGLWTEENFIQAMRTGKHMGSGRPILPPMPWMNLTRAKEQDLKAIFTYLKSVKPIKNLVPGAIPPNELAQK
jgi:hypothetical protein